MLPLEDIRNIVIGCMPYDTGYMYLEGASFYDTNLFSLVRYEITRVPYIVYQEEGFVHWITGKMVTKNQFFIRDKTIGALINAAAYQQSGIKSPFDKLDDHVKRRGSFDMIKQGAIDKIKGSGYRAEYI